MQASLDIDLPPADRSLSTVESLRDWLRITHDEVLSAIENGVIPVAFDLRTPGAERAEVRIWHPTVEALVRSRGRDSGPRLDADAVIARLVPEDVRSSALETLWSLSHQHVWGLIDSGCLPVRRRPAAASGPLSFAVLHSDGIRAFLRQRVVI